MPTYEYLCTKCGHEMEAFQSMKDEPLKQCPACKRRTLKRKVGGGAGLIFKGTGFYITDYKKKSGTKPETGDSKPDSKPSETKPAAPAAAK
jgi:putative FmdB family regulatory protein